MSSNLSAPPPTPIAESSSGAGRRERQRSGEGNIMGEWQTLKLWVHKATFSGEEALVRPDALPNLQSGQILEVYQPPRVEVDDDRHLGGNGSSHGGTQSFPLKGTPHGRVTPHARRTVLVMYKEPSRDAAWSSLLQISLSSEIQSAFGFQPRADVLVRRVDPRSVAADFVTLTFRDQYLGRSDMWRLTLSMQGTCAYVRKRILFAGCIQATVKEIYVGNQSVTCGYITADTKVIFRSESARFHLFLQMSQEMWDFDEDGELFFEKATNGFIPELFRRWEEASTHHVVSIILFARIQYQSDGADRSWSQGLGTWYRDFYKVLADNETTGGRWRDVLGPLRRELVTFQQHILQQQDGEYVSLVGHNSTASEGNVLEAINLALNTFDRHYVDRDLLRTGLSIVVVTPGTGLFHVDKALLRMTTERMFDAGIALDLVCLSRFPIHPAHLFSYRSRLPRPARAPRAPPSRANGSTTRIGRRSTARHGSSSGINMTSGASGLSTLGFVDPLAPNVGSTTPPSMATGSVWGATVAIAVAAAEETDPLYQDPEGEDESEPELPSYIRKKGRRIKEEGSDRGSQRGNGAEEAEPEGEKEYFYRPHWIVCSFYGGPPAEIGGVAQVNIEDIDKVFGPQRQKRGGRRPSIAHAAPYARGVGRIRDPTSRSADNSPTGFIPHCKMPSVQMMNITGEDLKPPSLPDLALAHIDLSATDPSLDPGSRLSEDEVGGMGMDDCNHPAVPSSLPFVEDKDSHDRDVWGGAVGMGRTSPPISLLPPMAPAESVSSGLGVIANHIVGTPSGTTLGPGMLMTGGNGQSGDSIAFPLPVTPQAPLQTTISGEAGPAKATLIPGMAMASRGRRAIFPTAPTSVVGSYDEGGDRDGRGAKILSRSFEQQYGVPYGAPPPTSSGVTHSRGGRRGISEGDTEGEGEGGGGTSPTDHPGSGSSHGSATTPTLSSMAAHVGAVMTGSHHGTPSIGPISTTPVQPIQIRRGGGSRRAPIRHRGPPAPPPQADGYGKERVFPGGSIPGTTSPLPMTPSIPGIPQVDILGALSGTALNLRRWEYAIPIAGAVYERVGEIHWTSLVNPACLPLCTAWMPGGRELATAYQENVYIISAHEEAEDSGGRRGGGNGGGGVGSGGWGGRAGVTTPTSSAEDEELIRRRSENLLKELIGQRLAQGFQLVTEGRSKKLVGGGAVGGGLSNLLGTGDKSAQPPLSSSPRRGLTPPVNHSLAHNMAHAMTSSLTGVSEAPGVTSVSATGIIGHMSGGTSNHGASPHLSGHGVGGSFTSGTVTTHGIFANAHAHGSGTVGSVGQGGGATGGGGGASGHVLSSTPPSAATLGLGCIDGTSGLTAAPHFLSMGHHIQRLSYDRTLRNVEVKQYRRIIRHSTAPIAYSCDVWGQGRDGYVKRPVVLRYPGGSTYRWNYLDHYVAGHQRQMEDSLRFWRTRFALLPAPSISQLPFARGIQGLDLTEEELRLAGFSRFLEVFERARFVRERDRTGDRDRERERDKDKEREREGSGKDREPARPVLSGSGSGGSGGGVGVGGGGSGGVIGGGGGGGGGRIAPVGPRLGGSNTPTGASTPTQQAPEGTPPYIGEEGRVGGGSSRSSPTTTPAHSHVSSSNIGVGVNSALRRRSRDPMGGRRGPATVSSHTPTMPTGILATMGITLTTEETSSWVEEEANRKTTLAPVSDWQASLLGDGEGVASGLGLPGSLPTLGGATDVSNLPLPLVGRCMRRGGAAGVRIGTRMWHRKRYEDVFIGSDFVDWAIRVLGMDGRDAALSQGNQWMLSGLFTHVDRRLPLLDGHYFYRLTAEYATDGSGSGMGGKEGLPSSSASISTSYPISRTASDSEILGAGKDGTTSPPPPPPPSPAPTTAFSFFRKAVARMPPLLDGARGVRAPAPLHPQHALETPVGRTRDGVLSEWHAPPAHIDLSRAITVNLDPQRKSDRVESAILHYDALCSIPRGAYHFQLNWLGATGHLIEDLIQNWSRHADRYGLLLVEVPVEQVRDGEGDDRETGEERSGEEDGDGERERDLRGQRRKEADRLRSGRKQDPEEEDERGNTNVFHIPLEILLIEPPPSFGETLRSILEEHGGRVAREDDVEGGSEGEREKVGKEKENEEEVEEKDKDKEVEEEEEGEEVERREGGSGRRSRSGTRGPRQEEDCPPKRAGRQGLGIGGPEGMIESSRGPYKDNFFLVELARAFGFLLDQEADSHIPSTVDTRYSYLKTPYTHTQYIHQSGVAFLQLWAHGFRWLDNRLLASHTAAPIGPSHGPAASSPDPGRIRRALEDICSDAERLRTFYRTSTLKWVKSAHPEWLVREGRGRGGFSPTTSGTPTPRTMEMGDDAEQSSMNSLSEAEISLGDESRPYSPISAGRVPSMGSMQGGADIQEEDEGE